MIEIAKGTDLGYNDRHNFIKATCPICKNLRWTRAKGTKRTGYKPRNIHCISCGNMRSGGRIPHSKGYILIKLRPDNIFYEMTDSNGYVLEHRLVMAQHLGRCLSRDEQVHHINGIKTDNKRAENLLMVDIYSHGRNYIDGYREGYKEGYSKALKRGDYHRMSSNDLVL